MLAGMHATAQYRLKENNIWAFGNYAGLDFTAGTPVAFRSGLAGGVIAREANASVCDANGTFLFCTNGETIWDRTTAVMPSANPLHPYAAGAVITKSTTQGALIIPFPDSADRYYVFSLTNKELGTTAPGAGKLFYSVVDMRLNGGRGDVVPGRKWQLLDSNLTEKMTAVPGDDCNIWLLVRSRDSSLFKAYELTHAGISSTPVLSYAGASGNASFWVTGELKASPDRKKLVACAQAGHAAELYDFNPATGTVTNALQLDGQDEFYGAAFSPDQRKLYLSYNPVGVTLFHYICQFDLSAPTPAAIIASRTRVGSCSFSQLRLARDGKIYFQTDNTTGSLGVIANPNATGAACQFTGAAVSLLFTTGMNEGLPAEVVKALPPDTALGKRTDTAFCAGLQSMLLEASPGFSGYRWNNGTPGSRLRITGAGKYVVYYKRDDCHYGVDSFLVRPAETRYSRKDTGFCAGEASLELHAPEGGLSYQWDDAGAADVRTVDRPGVYWVKSIRECRFHTDTFVVGRADLQVRLGNDTVVCNDGPLLLRAPVPGAAFLWSDGSTDSTFAATRPGSWWVRVSKDGCVVSDTIAVRFIPVAQALGSDTVICMQDQLSLTLRAHVPEGASALWSDGSTGDTLQVSVPGSWWVRVTAAMCTGSDTLMVTSKACNCIPVLPSAFTPNGDGRNDILRPVLPAGCPADDCELRIFNRWGQQVYGGTGVPGWDGSYNGLPAEIGAYMYRFRYGQQEWKGDVTLIR